MLTAYYYRRAPDDDAPRDSLRIANSLASRITRGQARFEPVPEDELGDEGDGYSHEVTLPLRRETAEHLALRLRADGIEAEALPIPDGRGWTVFAEL